MYIIICEEEILVEFNLEVEKEDRQTAKFSSHTV